MAGFNSELTVDQLALLRSGRWAAEQKIILCPNNVVLHGQITTDLSANLSWGQFDYTLISGDYTKVWPDQVLLIGDVDDIKKATYRGRARLAPSSSIIYASESSQDFTDAYFWIIDTYDITDRLSRPVNKIQKKDYDRPYQGIRPRVKGIQTGYYIDVPDPITGKYRVSFSITALSNIGTPTSSVLWQFPSGMYTVVSGSLSSTTVVVDFEPGFFWGHLTATDVDGVPLVRNFAIAADDGSLAATGFTGAAITGNLQNGFNAKITAFDGVDDTLDNTFIILARSNEICGNSTGPAVGTNIDLIGWIRHEDNTASVDQKSSTVSETSFDIVGVSAKLAKIEGQLISMTIVTDTPTLWDQISLLCPPRAYYNFGCEHTTAFNLCDTDFGDYSVDYTFHTIVTQEGVALGNLDGLAHQVVSKTEFAPDGRTQMVKDYGYMDSTERDALNVVANWTAEDGDYIGTPQLGTSRDHDKNVGKVDGVGAAYSTFTLKSVGYESRAPGHAQGSANGEDTLSQQILKANQTAAYNSLELRQRTGNHLNVVNNTLTLTVTHPDSYYSFLCASHFEFYTHDIDFVEDGMAGSSRIKFDSSARWTIEAISYVHDNKFGTRTGTVTYKVESAIGDPGDDTTPVPSDITDPTIPPIPPIDAFPGFPDIVIPDLGYLPDEVPPGLVDTPVGKAANFDGNEVLVWTAERLWTTHTFITLHSSVWIEITPPDIGSFEIRQAMWDPFFTKTKVGAYCLGSDGTHSAVWYNPNAFDPSGWVKGEEVDADYSEFKTGNTAGSVLAWTQQADQIEIWEQNIDFTTRSGSFAPFCGSPAWASGGWASGGIDLASCSLGVNKAAGTIIDLTLPSGDYDTITMTFDAVEGPHVGAPSDGYTIVINGILEGAISNDVTGTDLTVDWSGSVSGTPTLRLTAIAGDDASSYPAYGSSLIKSVRLTGTGPNPFTDFWEKIWDFTVSPDGWNSYLGNWVEGQGYTHVDHIGGPDGHTLLRSVEGQSLYGLPVCQIKYEYSYLGGYTESAGCAGHSLTVQRRYPPTPDTGTQYCLSDGDNTYGFDQFVNYPVLGITSDIYGFSVGNFYGHVYLTAMIIQGTGSNPFRTYVDQPAVIYSDDYGATFADPEPAGFSVSGKAGFDVIQISGGLSLAGADDNTQKAASLGGAYTDEATGPTPGGYAKCLLIPLSEWNTDTVRNYNTSAPDFLLATNKVISGHTLQRRHGAVVTSISPSGTPIVVGPFGATSYLGSRIAIIMGGHLYTSTDAGDTWTDQGTADEVYIRVRYGARYPGQLFLGGGTSLRYSKNFGDDMFSRVPPVASGILGIEPLG